ncbi:MAG: FAD-dependent thymidylate synthase [Candidatus Aenigmarchaeota archaeon]|nr:FAD-dependent thymidylate synthase [Candidatus Aenigmarchaeota archaeon]
MNTTKSNTHFLGLFSIVENAESLIVELAKEFYKYPPDTPDAVIIGHLFDHNHWDIFGKIRMGIIINTTSSEAIKITQIKPFSFTYLANKFDLAIDFIPTEVEPQSVIYGPQNPKIIDDETTKWFAQKQKEQFEQTVVIYNETIEKGISPKTARMLLPLSTRTAIVMMGEVPNWIQFLRSRTGDTTIDNLILPIKEVFDKELPTIGALF